MKDVLQPIAKRLGNTPAMCRKCYVNPVVIDAFLAGELRHNTAPGGGKGRVRLLQLLARTPAGLGFKGALQKRPKKRPVRATTKRNT
jgi:DNA topoisomerase IB